MALVPRDSTQHTKKELPEMIGVPHCQAQGPWPLAVAELRNVPSVPEEFYLIWITATTVLDDTFVNSMAPPSLTGCDDWP